MAQATDVRGSTALPGGGAHLLLLRLCTSNPFYVLSAGFFLAGLWISFGGQTQTEETWALMSGLAGYTLLLAVTAFMLVRFCKLWDDLRTVLLLVVLMFVAMSVTFDELLVQVPESGIACSLGGLLFAIAVSESLLRGIRLRLPPLFRGPYYLLLALFFLYPLALIPLLEGERTIRLWALFGFVPAAALIFLTLLPALRRGPAYVEGNGSPWPWPLYPWVLFGVLAIAVCGRAWLLCVSMDLLNLGHGSRVIFAPYFLVPLGLAGAILLLEASVVASSRRVQQAAMLAPLALIFLSVAGQRNDPIYRDFLRQLIGVLERDPLNLTLLICAGYYGYAMIRRVPSAAEGLTVALALLAVMNPVWLEGGPLLRNPQPEPLLVIALVQLALGLRGRSAWRCGLGATALICGWALTLAEGTLLDVLITLHCLLFVILLVGALFDDAVARAFRLIGATLALYALWMCLFAPLENLPKLPSWVYEVYPPGMAIFLAGYGLLLRCRPALALAALGMGSWLVTFGMRGYGSLRQLVSGLDYLIIGLTLFGVALLISLAKAGVLARGVLTRWRAPDSSR